MPRSAGFTEDIELPAGTAELVELCDSSVPWGVDGIDVALIASAALAISLSLTQSRHVIVRVEASQRAVEPAGRCVPQPHRPAYLILITRPARDWLGQRCSHSWDEFRAPLGVCGRNGLGIG